MSDYLKWKREKQLAHSAKGTTWDEHQYIKVEDGKYYYPDDYAGGRHLNSDKKDGTASSGNKEQWEKVLMPGMDDLFKKNPELLDKSKYPSEQAWGQAVVAKIGTILQANKDLFDPNKYTPEQINQMREKTKKYFAEILQGNLHDQKPTAKKAAKKEEVKEDASTKKEAKKKDPDEEKKKKEYLNKVYGTYRKRR